MGLVILAVLGVALLAALGYDLRQRRNGSRRRSSAEMSHEARHSRIDINAVPYEPARQPGQRDWATYRARDRKPPRE